MAVAPFCTCVMLTVLSTSQIILGYPSGYPPLVARDPYDHHIYSPPIQYATDLFKDNVFDYSKFFTDYDYQSGTRNSGRENPNNNYQKQQGLGYTYYQNSPNQQAIGNQGSQTSENSPKPGAYHLALPNLQEYQSYNNDQTMMNAIPNLLGMLPFVGGFFSQQPSHSQQATYDGQPKYNTNSNHLHKPISTVHINPTSYETVPISKPNNPNIPLSGNDQIFLQTLALNPALLSQMQMLLQAQGQGVPQLSPGQLTGSLQTPNAPSAFPQESSASLKTNSQTQGTAPPIVPVATAEGLNPSQTLTTPPPTTASKTPSGTQLPPALPAGNVPLTSSLPAPSPAPAPPLAVSSVSGNQ